MESSPQLDTATAPTGTSRMPDSLCTHSPKCPSAASPDREAARVVAAHPEQGWSLLCNALVVFDDTGELLPDGQIIAPHRPTDAPASTLALRLADAHALIGGTTGSGKTSMAAFHQALVGTAHSA